jgi:DNA replication and repair protein RecF
MRIEGNFIKNNQEEKIVCILRENGKKEMQRNGEDYKRFSLHIGQFPAVMIAPDDVELITGNSDIRRKFIDTLLSQIDKEYLTYLIEYNKVLLQRNSFLKSCAEKGYVDEYLFEVLNNQLINSGLEIHRKRKNFLTPILPLVEENYQTIAGSPEPVNLSYYSPLLEGDFKELLNTYRQKDLLLQRTTLGIHKDDIEINFNNQAFKNTASQGQRKSLLFAFKLVEFEELKKAKGFPPLLLLDDVFEKLDAQRMQNLLFRVCVENNGQVFITDTHKERLQNALEELQVNYQLVELK